MTAGQFFLGCVTIAVATIVYRWQKSIDRETIALAELRQLMAKYAAISHRLFLEQPYRDEGFDEEKFKKFFTISSDEMELYIVRDQLFISAPKKVVDSVLKCDAKFRDCKSVFTNESAWNDEVRAAIKNAVSEFKFAHEQMLISMREEIQRHHQMPWPKLFGKLLGVQK